MKTLSKFLIVTILISSFLFSEKTFASEVTGTLNTGISGNSGSGVEGTVIVEPTANPGGGTYTSTQNVTLTASGASSIHYSTDSSTPSCSTGSTYSGSITIASSKSIKALSCYPSNNHSNIVTFSYTINPPAIVVSDDDSNGSSDESSVVNNTPTPSPTQTPTPTPTPQTTTFQTNNIPNNNNTSNTNVINENNQGTSTDEVATTTSYTFVNEPINSNNNANAFTAGVGDALPFNFSQGILWFSLAFLLGLLIYLGYKVVAKEA